MKTPIIYFVIRKAVATFTTGCYAMWLLTMVPAESVAQINQRQELLSMNQGFLAHANPDVARSVAPARVLADEAGITAYLFPQDNPLSMRLLIQNNTGRTITLGLFDDQNNLLYINELSTGETWKRLTLRDVSEGRYTLKLMAGRNHISRSFTITAPQPIPVVLTPRIVF